MMSDAGTPVLRRPIRERTALGLTVICAGGLMDAYSYLTRGNVFATGQTGNVVLLAIHLAQLDWRPVSRPHRGVRHRHPRFKACSIEGARRGSLPDAALGHRLRGGGLRAYLARAARGA